MKKLLIFLTAMVLFLSAPSFAGGPYSASCKAYRKNIEDGFLAQVKPHVTYSQFRLITIEVRKDYGDYGNSYKFIHIMVGPDCLYVSIKPGIDGEIRITQKRYCPN